jgi:hypothetical protein
MSANEHVVVLVWIGHDGGLYAKAGNGPTRVRAVYACRAFARGAGLKPESYTIRYVGSRESLFRSAQDPLDPSLTDLDYWPDADESEVNDERHDCEAGERGDGPERS